MAENSNEFRRRHLPIIPNQAAGPTEHQRTLKIYQIKIPTNYILQHKYIYPTSLQQISEDFKNHGVNDIQVDRSDFLKRQGHSPEEGCTAT